MRLIKTVFFLVFFILITMNVFSSGKKEKAPKATNAETASPAAVSPVSPSRQPGVEHGNTRIILGQVRVFGSEPRTYVGIVAENGTEYSVYPPEKEAELRNLQGRLLEFTVTFLDEPQGQGSLYLKGGTVTPLSWEIMP